MILVDRKGGLVQAWGVPGKTLSFTHYKHAIHRMAGKDVTSRQAPG
jgi:hypothetical protein